MELENSVVDSELGRKGTEIPTWEAHHTLYDSVRHRIKMIQIPK